MNNLLDDITAATDKQSAVGRYHDAVLYELRQRGLLSDAVEAVIDELWFAVDRMDVDNEAMVF